MSEYKTDRTWSDKHLDDVRGILTDQAATLLSFEVAPDELDKSQSTDMLVSVGGGQVAVRMRRGAYLKYNDITIRSYRPQGKTELEKLRAGFADWYLYIWYDQSDELRRYALIDLHVVRSSPRFYEDGFFRELQNKDGTKFIAIPWGWLESVGALKGYINPEGKEF